MRFNRIPSLNFPGNEAFRHFLVNFIKVAMETVSGDKSSSFSLRHIFASSMTVQNFVTIKSRTRRKLL